MLRFFAINVPYTPETLWIIFPYSVGVTAVGLLESLPTASIVDQMTDTRSDKNRHQDLPFFLASGRAKMAS